MTATQGLIDLSFAPGKNQDLADLPFDKAVVVDHGPEDISELNVAHAQLGALTCTPEALINEALQYVTVLRAAHNEISSLRGIEAFCALEVLDLSHNQLHVVDSHAASLLRSLRDLRTLDFSHNNMHHLDLDNSRAAPSSRRVGSGSVPAAPSPANGGATSGNSRLSLSAADESDGLLALNAVNLSHNAFIELPDLRCAPYLQVLNISHNKLETLIDLELRLPLLSLHSLLLHANQLPTATSLLPLCGLAQTLRHVQVFRNPFTLAPLSTAGVSSGHQNGEAGSRSRRIDTSMWWRPFLLWLCPHLITVDLTEFTASERRVAGMMLFRQHGVLSKSSMELMNPQRKDDLEAYLRRKTESAVPPVDAVAIIEEIEQEEESRQECLGGGRNREELPVTVVPMSHTNPARGHGASQRSAFGIPKGSSIMYADHGSSDAAGLHLADTTAAAPSAQYTAGGPAAQSMTSIRTTTKPSTSTSTSASANRNQAVSHHNHQRSSPATMSSVVRALQQKIRAMEEVVAVLWRADLARRTAAAIIIQRFIRGALARMRLSDEDAESFRFIRYQLRQATATAIAAAAAPPVSGGNGSAVPTLSVEDGGAIGTRSSSQRHPSLEPMDATGSNIQEVLLSMRSLQEVMSSMWVDLEEYRAMADREQRRAAILIQRSYRGYCARRRYGRIHRRSCVSLFSANAAVLSPCHCGTETATLRQEVQDLRNEVRELRELLQQSARQQRLAVYSDAERAMDAIIQKHEKRSKADPVMEAGWQPRSHDESRSPSATPSFTDRSARAGTSQDKNGDSLLRQPTWTSVSAGEKEAEPSTQRTSHLEIKVPLDRQTSTGAVFSGSLSSNDMTSPTQIHQQSHPTRIQKVRPSKQGS